eukprot:scaffold162818_cov66-Attheya_sp.AAC.1
MQVQAITSLINIDLCGGKIFLVAKTGTGKSHGMQILRTASQAYYGAVNYYHLDEYRDRPQTMNLILSQVDALSQDTTSTVFLFSSPQQ